MKFVIVILLAFALLAFGCTTTRQQAEESAKGAVPPANIAGEGTGNNTLAASAPANSGNPLPYSEEVAGFTQQGAGAQPETLPEQPASLPLENMNVPQAPSPEGGVPYMPLPEMQPENFTPAPPPPPPPPMPISPLVPVPA